jgi:hypothetical protein
MGNKLQYAINDTIFYIEDIKAIRVIRDNDHQPTKWELQISFTGGGWATVVEQKIDLKALHRYKMIIDNKISSAEIEADEERHRNEWNMKRKSVESQIQHYRHCLLAEVEKLQKEK